MRIMYLTYLIVGNNLMCNESGIRFAYQELSYKVRKSIVSHMGIVWVSMHGKTWEGGVVTDLGMKGRVTDVLKSDELDQ